MDLPRHPLSRSDFLRWMGWSTVGFLFSGGLGLAERSAKESASTDDGLIEKLFEESLVIDGVGSLGTKRGEELRDKASLPLTFQTRRFH